MRGRSNKRFVRRPVKTDMPYEEFFDMIVNIGEELNFYYNDVEYWISYGENHYLTDATNKISQNLKPQNNFLKTEEQRGKALKTFGMM